MNTTPNELVPDDNLMLNFVASLNCASNTGKRWIDVDGVERQFWRNDAKIQALEWFGEMKHLNTKRHKTADRTTALDSLLDDGESSVAGISS